MSVVPSSRIPFLTTLAIELKTTLVLICSYISDGSYESGNKINYTCSMKSNAFLHSVNALLQIIRVELSRLGEVGQQTIRTTRK